MLVELGEARLRATSVEHGYTPSWSKHGLRKRRRRRRAARARSTASRRLGPDEGCEFVEFSTPDDPVGLAPARAVRTR
jgi:hypothetical protein